MTLRISPGYTAPVVADPHFSSVSLLIHANGANGSTTFSDSSSNNFSISKFGNAQISTTQSKFGGSSLYLDGNGDYLTVPDNIKFDLSGTTPYTIELWFYANSLSNSPNLIGKSDYGANFSWNLSVDPGGIYTGTDGTNSSLYSPVVITASVWHHIAVVGNGASMTHFFNGVAVGTKTLTLTNASASIAIGAVNFDNPNQFLNGYIDEVRITKGVARYIADFSVPTSAFPDS